MRSGAKWYWALFFILCLDFGGVGFNNFIGAFIVAFYVIPVVFIIVILAWPDKKNNNENGNNKHSGPKSSLDKIEEENKKK